MLLIITLIKVGNPAGETEAGSRCVGFTTGGL